MFCSGKGATDGTIGQTSRACQRGRTPDEAFGCWRKENSTCCAPIEPKPAGHPSLILTVLAFYAIGAAVGRFATAVGAAMLAVPATAVAAAGLLTGRRTGLRQHH